MDGVPRTLRQAKLMQQSNLKIDILFNFKVCETVIIEKLMGRRVCPTCNTNYNIVEVKRDGYFWKALNPKVEGFCDHCTQTKLVSREDDNQEVVAQRLKTYH